MFNKSNKPSPPGLWDTLRFPSIPWCLSGPEGQACTWGLASSVEVASPHAQHHQGSTFLAAGGFAFWIWPVSKQPRTNKATTRKGKPYTYIYIDIYILCYIYIFKSGYCVLSMKWGGRVKKYEEHTCAHKKSW